MLFAMQKDRIVFDGMTTDNGISDWRKQIPWRIPLIPSSVVIPLKRSLNAYPAART
jgi:hypothetical protein